MHFILFLNRHASTTTVGRVLNNESCTYPPKSFNEHILGQAKCVTYHYDSFLTNEGAMNHKDKLYCVKGFLHSKKYGSCLQKIYSDLKNEADLVGDYLALKLDSSGMGDIIRPLMSYHQLFYFSDEETDILSTDLKLIIRASNKLNDATVNDISDGDFINDSIFNEWRERKHPHSTFIKHIKRVQTLDEIKINNFKIQIVRKTLSDYRPDEKLYNLYLTNRSYFYHTIAISIRNCIQVVFEKLNITNITLNLTGGLDSRTTLAILSWFQKNQFFDLNLQTYGPENHPDVVIAKRISKQINLPHTHHNNSNPLFPQSISDYQKCFKISLGDWNSNSYSAAEYRFINGLNRMHGQDNYKQCSDKSIYGLNRWGGKRMSCQDIPPILMTYETNQAALIYSMHDKKNGKYEYVENIIGSFCPDLLKIPFVGYALPNTGIAAYSTVAKSKQLPAIVAHAYFDENIVLKTLPLFRQTTILEKLASKIRFAPLIKIASLLSNFLTLNKRHSISLLDSERKKRIAMDYASIYDLNIRQLFEI